MNGKLALATGLIGGAALLSTHQVSADTGAPKTTNTPNIYLPAKDTRWRVYNTHGPYTAGSEVAQLWPAYFGGLNYKIEATLAPKVYQITTEDFGTVAIYADSDAQVTGTTPAVVPAPAPATPAVETPVAAPVAAATSSSADFYLTWIFGKESGNNPYAINRSSGACGLGQALPCSKLLNVCGSLGNVECQVSFFESYAIRAYGSTAHAYSFWQSHRWW